MPEDGHGELDDDEGQHWPDTPEQVIRKWREGERLLGGGWDLTEVCQHLKISEQTWHWWQAALGWGTAERQRPRLSISTLTSEQTTSTRCRRSVKSTPGWASYCR